MNSTLAERAMLVFEDVFLLEGEERRHAIHQACDGDEALRWKVELLLENISGIDIDEPDRPDKSSAIPFVPSSAVRYELLNEIGRGGMGVVYRAFDSQLNRFVAIKVICESVASTDVRRRFATEAFISAKLQHPGIAPVHEAGLLPDGRPYLAMKLVEGETLSVLLANRDDATVDQARFLEKFVSTCQVMAYAHSHDIIHRDLKPDNVMVGKFGEVQIMDWGLAKTVNELAVEPAENFSRGDPKLHDSESSRLRTPVAYETRFGLIMGTPAYMPPEHSEGRRGKQSDVFSLGAILCEILTGYPPYRADSPEELLNKSYKADLGEAYERLNTCGADKELVAIARDCLQNRADERPSHAGHVAQRISRYLREVQSRLRTAETAKARSEAKAIEEKKRRKVTMLLMLTALLLVVVVLGGWGWISQREVQQTRQQATRRSVAMKQVDEARAETIRLLQAASNAPIDDLAAWDAAQVSANQAMAMIPKGDIPLEFANDIKRLANQITTQANERKLLAEIECARERSLEQVTIAGQPEPTIRQRRCKQLEAVFQDTPLNPNLSDTSAAQQFVSSKERPVREALIGAIDEWIVACDSPSDRQWLAKTISDVDENAWRKQWRQAVIDDNLTLLRDRLDNEQTFAQSPRSVLNLCWSVKVKAPTVNTKSTLTRIHRLHVGDFWLNYALGDASRERGQIHLAAQHYQFALGMRPSSSLHRQIGAVHLATGWLEDALFHLQRAVELNDRSATSWELLATTQFRLRRLDDAHSAFERAKALSAGNLQRVIDYVNLLEQSNRRSEAIDFLNARPTNFKKKSDSLHRKLINLLCNEQEYLTAVQEFHDYCHWHSADPMLHVTVSAAAIMASDGIGEDSENLNITDRSELRQQAHDWLRFALALWTARRTSDPVLQEIVQRRHIGNFNSVYIKGAAAEAENEQQLAWGEFWSDVAESERQLSSFDSSAHGMSNWTILDPVSLTSESGANFERLSDGSFLVSGTSEERDVYTLTSEIDPEGIEAIRLDVIADERLPNRGPGRHDTGNFHLSEIEFRMPNESSEDDSAQLLFDRARATYSWQDRPIANAIDGDRQTIWHVWSQLGVSHTARFYLDHPIPPTNGKKLILRLVHGGDGVNATIGRFRLSFQRARLEP